MICEYGKCLHCGKDLMSACGTCGHKKPNNNYTEVRFDLTNGSKMPVAVCLDCKDKIFHADKKEIMKVVRAGWEKEHDKMGWDKDQRERYWQAHGEGILEIAE